MKIDNAQYLRFMKCFACILMLILIVVFMRVIASAFLISFVANRFHPERIIVPYAIGLSVAILVPFIVMLFAGAFMKNVKAWHCVLAGVIASVWCIIPAVSNADSLSGVFIAEALLTTFSCWVGYRVARKLPEHIGVSPRLKTLGIWF